MTRAHCLLLKKKCREYINIAAAEQLKWFHCGQVWRKAWARSGSYIVSASRSSSARRLIYIGTALMEITKLAVGARNRGRGKSANVLADNIIMLTVRETLYYKTDKASSSYIYSCASASVIWENRTRVCDSVLQYISFIASKYKGVPWLPAA